MNTKKTFAIIGCQHAHIGIFIEQMLGLGYRCAGLYEPDNIALAGKVAGRYDIPIVDDRRLLLGEEVGIVGCAAVNADKIDIIELCERHGKPVMIDKPAVTSREGLDRLRGVLERGRIEVGMLLTERFRPSIQGVRRLIAEGELGRIVQISMRKPHRLAAESRPSWHFSKERSGGIILDLLIHDFDLLRWLTGREVRSAAGVMAKGILPEHPDFYDAADVQVVLEGGITASLYADWHTPDACWTWGDGRIFIAGTEGTAEIRLEGDPLLGETETLLWMNGKEAWHKAELPSVGGIAEDFLDRIEGRPHLISHRDILAATEASVAANEKAMRIERTREENEEGNG